MDKSKELPERVELIKLQSILLEEIQGSKFPPGRRVQISLASLTITHEHHHAIAVLLEKKLHASAFALARPLYESLVKGLWLVHCAPESQLESFAANKELKSMNELTDDLLGSAVPHLISNSLRNVKKKYWKLMSSFAHAGNSQVTKWLNPDGVAPAYSEADVSQITIFTAFMTTVATWEMARLCGNEAAFQTIGQILSTTNER